MKKRNIYLILFTIVFGLASLNSYGQLGGKKISLDPGHGGSDPGALGPTAPHEAKLCLDMSLALRNRLQAAGATVSITRTTNTTVSLTARRNHFNYHNPNVAISVHLNSADVNTAHGTETFYSPSYGGWGSGTLASRVQSALIEKMKRANRGVKTANFTVITANVSVCLTEGLFINNPTEHAIITSSAGFDNWLTGHEYGIYDYLGISRPNHIDNIPVPTSPVANATDVEMPVQFSYSSPVDANAFRIQVSKSNSGWSAANGFTSSSDPSGSVIVNASVSGTSFSWDAGSGGTSEGPKPNTTYYWTLKSWDAATGNSSYSAVRSFTTAAPDPITLWKRADSNSAKPSWFGGSSDNTERGMAYGSERLFITSRKNGAHVYMVNALTGSDMGSLSTEGISGGLFPISDVETSWDGSILVSNMTIEANNVPFKIYRYSHAEAQPEVYINYTAPAAYRMGDTFTVLGSLSGNAQILAPVTGSNKIIRWIVSNGVLGSPQEISLGDFTFGAHPSVAPYGTSAGSDFLVNSQGNRITRFSHNGSGFVKNGEVSTAHVPTASNTIRTFVLGDVRYLYVFQSNNTANDPNGQNVRILDISDFASPNTLSVTPRLGNTSNPNGTGALAVRNTAPSSGNPATSLVYTLATNNGISAEDLFANFQMPDRTPVASLPSAGAQDVERPVSFAWSSPMGETAFRIQVSKSNSGWSAQNGFTSSSDASATVVVNAGVNGSSWSWSADSDGIYEPAQAQTTYYWTVRSWDAALGVSEYSPVRSFTTSEAEAITLWMRADANQNKPTWFGGSTDHTERGMAYTNDMLFVTSRKNGAHVYIVNALNGEDMGSLNTQGISGGLFPISDVEAGWDGSVLVCNMTIDANRTAFKVYRYTDTNASPTVYINYTAPIPYRMGDTFTVLGNLNNSAVIMAPVANSDRVVRWIVSNGNLGSPQIITMPAYTFGGHPSVVPYGRGATDAFLVNSQGTPVTLFTHNGTSYQKSYEIPSSIVPTGSNSIKSFVLDGKRYLYAFQSNNTANDPNGQNVRVLDITDMGAPELIDVTPRLGNTSNPNGTGAVAVRNTSPSQSHGATSVVYTLATNNGLSATDLFENFVMPKTMPTNIGAPDVFASDKNEVRIYPNPAKDYFRMDLPENALVQIYDIYGKLVLSREYSGETRIDLHDFSTGIYIVNVVDGQNVSSHKVVVRK